MAKKNVLQFILLGLLNQRELAGYDIKKLFDCEIGDFWHSKHSQIYPELKRLEEEQLITVHTTIVGTRLEKKIYRITPAGQSRLKEWLAEPLEPIQPTRDEFTMKLYLITDPHDPQLPALFAEEIARHQEKQEYLQARAATLAACPPEAAPGYGHQRILAHAILRETLQLRWLKKEYHRLPRK